MIKSEQIARTTFSRDDSWAKAFFWAAFNPFASMGRLLIEAFIRRNMGERYFRRAAVIRVGLFLLLWPFVNILIISRISSLYSWGVGTEGNDSGFDLFGFILRYGTWYLYLAAFLYAAYQRLDEIKRLPSALDLKRYSLSTGDIKEAFYQYKFWGRTRDTRFIECWLEPAPFFLAGLLLVLIGQPLGWLLIFCSIAYSVSYNMAYYLGDNTVMDIADAIIIQEDLKEVFMEDRDLQEARGIRWRGRRPVDTATRQEVLQKMMGDEDDFFVQ